MDVTGMMSVRWSEIYSRQLQAVKVARLGN